MRLIHSFISTVGDCMYINGGNIASWCLRGGYIFMAKQPFVNAMPDFCKTLKNFF